MSKFVLGLNKASFRIWICSCQLYRFVQKKKINKKSTHVFLSQTHKKWHEYPNLAREAMAGCMLWKAMEGKER